MNLNLYYGEVVIEVLECEVGKKIVNVVCKGLSYVWCSWFFCFDEV